MFGPPSGVRICLLRHRHLETHRSRGRGHWWSGAVTWRTMTEEVGKSIKKRHYEEQSPWLMDQLPVAFIEDLALSTTMSLPHTRCPCISE
nr:unknown [Zea mays]